MVIKSLTPNKKRTPAEAEVLPNLRQLGVELARLRFLPLGRSGEGAAWGAAGGNLKKSTPSQGTYEHDRQADRGKRRAGDKHDCESVPVFVSHKKSYS